MVSHSQRELDRDGRKVSKAPKVKTYEWTNPNTGEVIRVPEGVDPGWAYNPGKTAWGQNEALRLMEDQGPWVDLAPWGPEAYKRPERIVVDIPKALLGKRARTEKGLREGVGLTLLKKMPKNRGNKN